MPRPPSAPSRWPSRRLRSAQPLRSRQRARARCCGRGEVRAGRSRGRPARAAPQSVSSCTAWRLYVWWVHAARQRATIAPSARHVGWPRSRQTACRQHDGALGSNGTVARASGGAVGPRTGARAGRSPGTAGPRHHSRRARQRGAELVGVLRPHQGRQVGRGREGSGQGRGRSQPAPRARERPPPPPLQLHARQHSRI